MNVNELRVGNYIDNNVECFQIQAKDLIFLLAFDNEHYANPIPLTDGWMLKFGFKKDYKFYKIESELFEIENIKGEFWYFTSGKDVNVKFVHQLQNLYFALTQEELCLKP